MNVRCWNCGNDQEVVVPDSTLAERTRIVELLKDEARLAGTVGDVYRRLALLEAASLIERG